MVRSDDLPNHGKCLVVIRLLGHFPHIFDMADDSRRVDDEQGPGEQGNGHPFQKSPVVGAKAAVVCVRYRRQVVSSLELAKPLLGKWQVQTEGVTSDLFAKVFQFLA